MHETIIVKQILKQLEKYSSIQSITIEVGDLAHVTIQELKPVIESLCNYKINYKSKKAIIKCTCGFKGEPTIKHHSHDLTIYTCPSCNTPQPQVIEGDQITLLEVTTS